MIKPINKCGSLLHFFVQLIRAINFELKFKFRKMVTKHAPKNLYTPKFLRYLDLKVCHFSFTLYSEWYSKVNAYKYINLQVSFSFGKIQVKNSKLNYYQIILKYFSSFVQNPHFLCFLSSNPIDVNVGFLKQIIQKLTKSQ